MIKLFGTTYNNIQCYTISINNKSFLFVSKPDLSKLKYFNPCFEKQFITSSDNKKQMISQAIDFSSLNVHLDLNYLKQIVSVFENQSHGTYNIMLTNYQDFIVLPYLYRRLSQLNKNKQKCDLEIFTTLIMYEMGCIYLQQFYERIKKYDLLNLKPKKLSFQEQSQLEDAFYQQYGVQIKNWIRIFSRDDMNNVLKLVKKLNYGQIHDGNGVKFQPLPSGHSLGSSMWLFQNTLTKQTILFTKQMSNQTWRSIAHNYLLSKEKNAQIFRQKNVKNVDLLIFANSSLISQSNINSDQRIFELIKSIATNLQNNINTDIVLEDQLIFLDIIQHLSFQMKDKFKQVFVQNSSFNQIVSYTNSYVQFLSNQYKGRIYRDPPEYPFQSHLDLRKKGLAFTGSLFQIAQKQKIPLKQLLRRSTPYLNFKSDYSAYLSSLSQKDSLKYKQRSQITPLELNFIISNLNPKKIISYTNIIPYIDSALHQDIGIVSYDRSYQIDSSIYNYYLSKDISPNIINKYKYVDGYIMAYPVNRQFLRLGSNWKEQLRKYLKEQYRQVLQINQNGLKTANTTIYVKQYEIFIKGTDLREVQIILQIISTITRTLRLK